MSASFAIYLIAFSLILKGMVWFSAPQLLKKAHPWLLRSKTAPCLLFGGASIWVLWHITHLGEADFGQYKGVLFVIFAIIAIGSFLYVKDFLAVRGWAILILLISKLLLDAIYLEPIHGRIWVVSLLYCWILCGLYFGALPYKMRDLTTWIAARPKVIRSMALFFVAYGSWLLLLQF